MGVGLRVLGLLEKSRDRWTEQVAYGRRRGRHVLTRHQREQQRRRRCLGRHPRRGGGRVEQSSYEKSCGIGRMVAASLEWVVSAGRLRDRRHRGFAPGVESVLIEEDSIIYRTHTLVVGGKHCD